jgi:branched-chain amino acid aminotransferase
MTGGVPTSGPMLVWIDGRFVDPDEPVLSVLDHGVLVGDGVFESVRVVHGVPLALDRHLDRLQRSALGLGIAAPDPVLVQAGVDAVLARLGPAPSRLRVTVTSGPGPLGSLRGDEPPTVMIHGAPMAPYPPTAHVAIVPWPRNERGATAGLKTTSYAENVVALAHARAQGAGEAIFANTRGELCEGSGSNVFVVRDGRVCTPPLSSGCLAGVTRALVVELAGVTEQVLPLDALTGAEEAFLTSTTRGVHPIATVDGRALAACPGPRTVAAAAALDRYFGLAV